jgi:hypothetical protein
MVTNGLLQIWPTRHQLLEDNQKEIRLERTFVDFVNHKMSDTLERLVAL